MMLVAGYWILDVRSRACGCWRLEARKLKAESSKRIDDRGAGCWIFEAELSAVGGWRQGSSRLKAESSKQGLRPLEAKEFKAESG